jgi:hypothetical protein
MRLVIDEFRFAQLVIYQVGQVIQSLKKNMFEFNDVSGIPTNWGAAYGLT